MKRILLIVVFFLMFVGVLVQPAAAQTVSQPNQTETAVPANDASLPNGTDQQQFHVYAQNALIQVLSAVTCQLTGIDPTQQNGKCVNINPLNGKLTYQTSNGGAIGFMNGMIAGTFNIPISSRDYFSDLADNFGVAKKTYAAEAPEQTTLALDGGVDLPTTYVVNNNQNQGQAGVGATGPGFDSLLPFLSIWKAFRNIVYLLFIIIFVVIGLGIMLRLNTGNKTVMTIQNQIPKIIIGIILVSFSYAIAGLMIDIMWFSMYLIYAVMTSAGLPNFDTATYNPVHLRGANPLTLIGAGGIGGIAKDTAGGVNDLFLSLFLPKFQGWNDFSNSGNILNQIVNFATSGIEKGIVATFVWVAGQIVGLIAFLIIAIAIFMALFKVWFSLLRSYIFIVLDVILAPFWIAGALIPGSTIGFGRWIRDLAANLAVFPATVFLFMIGSAIINSVGKVQSHGQFVPPLIGNPGQANAVASLLGLGLIMISPQVINMVRDALKAPGNKYAAGVGTAISAGAAPLNKLGGSTLGRLTRKRNNQTGAGSGVARAALERWASKGVQTAQGPNQGQALPGWKAAARRGIGNLIK